MSIEKHGLYLFTQLLSLFSCLEYVQAKKISLSAIFTILGKARSDTFCTIGEAILNDN